MRATESLQIRWRLAISLVVQWVEAVVWGGVQGVVHHRGHGPVGQPGLPSPPGAIWETVSVAAVVIAGEEFALSKEAPLVFGRSDEPGVVGLDAADMGISTVAGAVEWPPA